MASMSDIEEKVAKELGFGSREEMHALIAKIDLSKDGSFEKFTRWKRLDGTKNGLLEILNELNGDKPDEHRP